MAVCPHSAAAATLLFALDNICLYQYEYFLAGRRAQIFSLSQLFKPLKLEHKMLLLMALKTDWGKVG